MADIVFHNRFTENERAYHDSDHRWYYVKNIEDDEVIMFRQSDTDIQGGGGESPSIFSSARLIVYRCITCELFQSFRC